MTPATASRRATSLRATSLRATGLRTTSLRTAGRLCVASDPRTMLLRSGRATGAAGPVVAWRVRAGSSGPPGTGRGSSARTGPPRPRLTVRGRLLMLLLVSGLLLVAFSLGRVSTSAATATSRTPFAQTVVASGDTLWSIAVRVAPANDPRETVAQLVRLNHLNGVGVVVGQRLLLPARS